MVPIYAKRTGSIVDHNLWILIYYGYVDNDEKGKMRSVMLFSPCSRIASSDCISSERNYYFVHLTFLSSPGIKFFFFFKIFFSHLGDHQVQFYSFCGCVFQLFFFLAPFIFIMHQIGTRSCSYHVRQRSEAAQTTNFLYG